MRITHLALAGVLLIVSTAAFAEPIDPNAEPTNCGFVQRDGRLVYLGACPVPSSDPEPDSEEPPQQLG